MFTIYEPWIICQFCHLCISVIATAVCATRPPSNLHINVSTGTYRYMYLIVPPRTWLHITLVPNLRAKPCVCMCVWVEESCGWVKCKEKSFAYAPFTHLPTHSPTHPLTHSLTHLLTRSLAQSLTHPLTHPTNQPTTRSPTQCGWVTCRASRGSDVKERPRRCRSMRLDSWFQ